MRVSLCPAAIVGDRYDKLELQRSYFNPGPHTRKESNFNFRVQRGNEHLSDPYKDNPLLHEYLSLLIVKEIFVI